MHDYHTTGAFLGVSTFATTVTWLPYIDMDLRILASFVAIISGIICSLVALSKLRKP